MRFFSRCLGVGLLALSFSAVAQVGPAPATLVEDPRAGLRHVWLRATGYDAAVFLPKGYGSVPGQTYPLVLSLHHRWGAVLDKNHTQVLAAPEGFIHQLAPGSALAETFPAIVVAPNAPARGADAPYDNWWNVGATHALVQEALTTYAVNPDRVTMTGVATGGAGVNELLVGFRSVFAGALVRSWFPPRPTPICSLKDFPLWGAGDADEGDFSAWDWSHAANPNAVQVQVAACPGYTGQFLMTVTPTGQSTSWNAFYARPDVQQWLVSQARSNQSPTVQAGADVTLTLPTQAVQLTGTATDLDGAVVSLLWEKVSGPAATLAGTNTLVLQATNLVAGTYTFKLTATDDLGASASDSVVVTVAPAPSAEDPRAGLRHIWLRAGRYSAAVFLPKGYGTIPGKKYPMVLSLHGKGGAVLDMNYTQVLGMPEGFIRQLAPGSALAETFPAIVLAPNARPSGESPPQEHWWGVADTHAIVQAALTTYAVDPDRVTMTGLSAGGAGVNDLLVQFRSSFAGALVQAWYPPEPTPICQLEAFPLWGAGNVDDGPNFPFWMWAHPGNPSSFMAQLTACPGYTGEFTLTANPTGGHSGWDTFYARPDVRQWLVSQVRK